MQACTTNPSCSVQMEIEQSLMAEREQFYHMPNDDMPRKEFMETVVKNNSICLRDRADLEALQNVIRRQQAITSP